MARLTQPQPQNLNDTPPQRLSDLAQALGERLTVHRRQAREPALEQAERTRAALAHARDDLDAARSTLHAAQRALPGPDRPSIEALEALHATVAACGRRVTDWIEALASLTEGLTEPEDEGTGSRVQALANSLRDQIITLETLRARGATLPSWGPPQMQATVAALVELVEGWPRGVDGTELLTLAHAFQRRVLGWYATERQAA
jgi:hypothetical protein